MNKTITEIYKRASEIIGNDPEKKAELMAELEEGRTELMAAKNAKEKAENLDEYNKASKAVEAAELKVKFAKNALARLETTPRMSEEEYNKYISACEGIMSQAAIDYRAKAAALMDQLNEIHEEYIAIAREVDGALIMLDDAAHILQSKHANETFGWKVYALRYEKDSDKAYKMATCCTEEEKTKPHYQWDSVLTAAWNAVKKGYPRNAF